MFSRKNANILPSTETFDRLMALDPTEFARLTDQLAQSILNLDANGQTTIMQEIIEGTSRKNSEHAATLQRFVPMPTPEAFNTTTDETIRGNAKKGTDHHALYKDMLSLSPEQKAQLIEKFGNTLTKFATCNVIFLYTEGSKVEDDKGVRNAFAIARQALGTIFSATDRNLKLEFFTSVLAELHSSSPFSLYQTESFVSATRQKSQYPNIKIKDDVSYLTTIKAGVNTANALTLFDSQTLQIVNNASVNCAAHK